MSFEILLAIASSPVLVAGVLAIAGRLSPLARWTRALERHTAIAKDLPESVEKDEYDDLVRRQAKRIVDYQARMVGADRASVILTVSVVLGWFGYVGWVGYQILVGADLSELPAYVWAGLVIGTVVALAYLFLVAGGRFAPSLHKIVLQDPPPGQPATSPSSPVAGANSDTGANSGTP